MRNNLRIVTPPTKLAVSISEARKHMRVEDLDNDDLIYTYVMSAQQSLSMQLGRSLVLTSYALDVYNWHRDIYLPMPPIRSVSAVKVRGTDGTLATITTSDYTLLLTSEGRGRLTIPGTWGWPYTSYMQAIASVEYTAGYDVVPAPLRAAILLMAGTLYDNRSDVGSAATYKVPGVENLISTYVDQYC